MIISYMDESIDMCKAGVFAVGGLLGRGPAFFELERKWGKLCKRPDINIGYLDSSWVEVILDSQKVALREAALPRGLRRRRMLECRVKPDGVAGCGAHIARAGGARRFIEGCLSAGGLGQTAYRG